MVFLADNRVVLSLFSLLGREANYTLDPGKLKLVLFIDFVMYIGYLSSCSCVPIYLFQTAQQHDLFKPMRRSIHPFLGEGLQSNSTPLTQTEKVLDIKLLFYETIPNEW